MTAMLNRPLPSSVHPNGRPNLITHGLHFDDPADAAALEADHSRLEEMARARLADCEAVGMTRAEIARASGIPNSSLSRIDHGGPMSIRNARAILTVVPVMTELSLMRMEWAHFRRMGGTPEEVRDHLTREYGWTPEELQKAARTSGGF